MKPAAVLLTGATGYLGRHLCHRLLERGHRVVALVRGEGGAARLHAALEPLSGTARPGPEVVTGDITLPDCGLDGATSRRLAGKGVAAVVHCAGLTRFEAHLGGAARRHNVEGTRRVHALARALGAESFHHLSTAFVAGDCRETFGETDLERDQGFNNPYEASKFEAERWLRRSHRPGERLWIHRPGIVVGGHPLGTGQGAGTVYTFLKVLHFLRCCWRRDPARLAGAGAVQGPVGLHLPLRIEGEPRLRVNLVPVEWVAEEIIHALERPDPGLVCRSLLGHDYSLERLRHQFSEAMGITGTRLVDAGAWAERRMTPLERSFHRATHCYLPYRHRMPRFPEEEKRGPELDPGRLARRFRHLLEGEPAAGLGERALDLLQVRGPEDYFHCLLDRRLGGSFLDRIRFVDCRVRFLLEGTPAFDRILHFRRGEVRYCDADERRWDFCYRLQRPLFEAIVRGRAGIREAFFAGRVRISGDREAALKFGYLFDDHFRHLEQRVLEEMCA